MNLLTLSLSEDCKRLVLSNLEANSILEDMFTGTNNDKISDYILHVDYNCCINKDIPLPVAHEFAFAVSGCGTESVNGTLYNYYDITVTTTLMIDAVQFLKYYQYPNVLYSEEYPIDYTFRMYFVNTDITANTIPFIASFTTVNGLTYTMEGSVTNVVASDHCNNTPTVIISSTTFPEIPEEIVVDSTPPTYSFGLTDDVFNQDATPSEEHPLLPGVYCVTLKGVNNLGTPLVDDLDPDTGFAIGKKLYQESFTYFVDCSNNLKCRVTQLASTCDNPEAIWIYEALVSNNTCQVLSCTDVCNLYRRLMTLLNNNCNAPAKPCDCK
jgi:hypothetical protein